MSLASKTLDLDLPAPPWRRGIRAGWAQPIDLSAAGTAKAANADGQSLLALATAGTIRRQQSEAQDHLSF